MRGRYCRGCAAGERRRWSELELERGADVDRLAVTPLILQRGIAVAFDIVADAAGQCDPARQRIRAAEIERDIVTLAKARDRVASRAIGADGNPRAQAIA